MPYDHADSQRASLRAGLASLMRLRARLGRDPTVDEIKADKSTMSYSWYHRRWGTIRRAVDCAMLQTPKTTRRNPSSHTSSHTER